MGKVKGKRVSRKAELPELGVDPRKAAPEAERRTSGLTIRLTPSERREVQDMADRFGVTVTAYLMGLHAQARRAVQGKGGQS